MPAGSPQSLRIPPSPRWAQRFRSDDLDEVRAFITRSDTEHSRVVHGRGAFAFDLSRLLGATTALGWAGAGLGQTVRGATRDPVVHVPTDHGIAYRFGHRQHLVGVGTPFFIPPGWEFTRRNQHGSLFGIAVSGQALAGEIAARRPNARSDWAFRRRELNASGAGTGAFATAIAELVQALGPARAACTSAQCEAALISVLADILLAESAVAPAATMATRRAADLEAWIEAHLEEPITLGLLCKIAGVGDRCLQKTFELRRGATPMRFVTERRLAAARLRLAFAEGSDTVTSIATALGFSHLGRFAALYRHAFGESPSQTLRQPAR
jgi:AraC-like DNA-binding protein